jgi:conjugal transfer ATP-binding protein TraC
VAACSGRAPGRPPSRAGLLRCHDYSPLGQGDRHERAIKSIYKAAGWDLTDERYLQIQGLLAAMPLTLADGLGADMERLKRFKTVLSTTAANIAPMQGEYLGSAHPTCCSSGGAASPSSGRRSRTRPATTMSRSAASRDRASRCCSRRCAALRGAGAQVVVIDDGRSFEHSVKLQGGRFVEFTMKAGFCLNPFSMIDGTAPPKTRTTVSTASG